MFWTICGIVLLVIFGLVSFLMASDGKKKEVVFGVGMALIPVASLVMYFVYHHKWQLWPAVGLWVVALIIKLEMEQGPSCPLYVKRKCIFAPRERCFSHRAPESCIYYQNFLQTSEPLRSSVLNAYGRNK
jgi:hypothetical protein